MLPVLLSVLAHTVADFIFQTDRTIDKKLALRPSGFFGHWSAVFFTLLVLLLPYGLINIFTYCLIVATIHIFLDLFKVFIEKRTGAIASLSLFLVDQFLHVLVIILLVPHFYFRATESFEGLVRRLTSYTGIDLAGLPVGRIVFTSIIYLSVVFGGAVFIRKLFDLIYRSEPDYLTRIVGSNTSLNNVRTGKVIGIFERLLVLTIYLTGNVASISIVVAAKSLARFKHFDNKDFAEYYLIGTLASVMLAITGGIILSFY
jgi:hypothetical protein